MLRAKLFKSFVAVIAIFSVLSAFFGISTIKKHVTDEAQQRVRLDLSSAWAVYNSQLHEIETILQLVATKQRLVDVAGDGAWDDSELLERMSKIRTRFGLDFLNVLSPVGQVMIRTTRPGSTGDLLAADPVVGRALSGNSAFAMALLDQAALRRESDDLAERAFLELEETPHARKTTRRVEDRGMAMVGAVPVLKGNQIIGIVYGGILVNRNHELIDKICEVVYRSERYGDQALGTATVFLHDSRIATTVRLQNGNRALGTRVSKEVADRVLDNGKPWVGEAFVVRDWYLSAYDPIRDIEGKIIGMLYVGILRKPFDAYGRSIVIRYLVLTGFVLLVAMVLAFMIAGRLAQPIHRLVEASVKTSNGNGYEQVPTDNACRETEELILAFNTMTTRLSEREDSLKALNRSYMETLGFVSHELKGPLGSMLNYVYLLRRAKLGDLNEKQSNALAAIERNVRRLVEMVRHYLNLSRIENGELAPVRTRVNVADDIVLPLIEDMGEGIRQRGMTVENRIDAGTILDADINMVREVFENLVGNAVKYGREGGGITLTAQEVNGQAEFRVRNDGEGITEDERLQLFGKFARLGQAAAGKPKGTGLGLFITKHIIMAHGGTIDVRSEKGQWIEFIFTLPLYAREEGDANV